MNSSPEGAAEISTTRHTKPNIPPRYRIDLDTVAAYRRNLIGSGRAKETNCSILIIVGRSDTGDLEAQVRGSRHAWDIRLISIDGLLRLMHLKEELDDPKIMEKIRQVLTPQEFTKVDGIIDLVFSTAEDVKKEEQVSEVADDDEDDQRKPKFTPINFRDACAAKVQKHLGQPLVKRFPSGLCTSRTRFPRRRCRQWHSSSDPFPPAWPLQSGRRTLRHAKTEARR